MWIRSCLAALDWNENCDRKPLFDKNGEPRVRVKVISSNNLSIISSMKKIIFLCCKFYHCIFQVNRARTKRTIQPVKEPKDYTLKDIIVNNLTTAF